MSQSTDGGITTTAQQHGAKILSLPLQGSGGNDYATSIQRTYIATPASAYAPIMAQRTAYTAALKYSDDIAQSGSWTVTRTTATTGVTTDPEGTITGNKLAEDNSNNTHFITQAMTVAAGALAFGVFAKAAERSYVRLRLNNGTDNDLAIAVFNLTTGGVVSGTGTIKQLLNGWYWCYVTGTATVSNSSAIIDLSANGSSFSYTGTTGSGVYLWRATAYLASAMGPAIATTSTTRAVTSPPVDVDDPQAFLVTEQECDASMLEIGVARWAREYANVPATVIVYGTLAITKPNPSALGTLIDNAVGGLTSGNYGPLYNYNNYWFLTTLTYVYGASVVTTSSNSGGNTRVEFSSAHTIAGTEEIMILQATNYTRVLPAEYSVVDADTIDILGVNYGTQVTLVAKFLRSYTPGPDRVRIRKTKSFYLPGLTLGIASAQDIPVPNPLTNDIEFLTQVVTTLSGFVTYDANPLDFWKGPIYQQELIAIDMATV